MQRCYRGGSVNVTDTGTGVGILQNWLGRVSVTRVTTGCTLLQRPLLVLY
jgi:hypothetical protein